MKKVLLLWFITTSLLYSNPNYFKVEGNSMYPALKHGNKVLTDNNITINNLNNGDIVVFRVGNDYVIHRLHKTEDILYTKGDNNPYKDRPYINEKSLIGKVIKINF